MEEAPRRTLKHEEPVKFGNVVPEIRHRAVDATGGYVAIWTIDIAMCVFASAMSLRIRDAAEPAAG